MQEFPAFQEVYSKRSSEFDLVSVTVDERADPRKLVSESGYGWTFVLSNDAAEKYQVSGIPLTLFIDAQGNIQDKHLGGMGVAEFESKLQKIL